eukprot:CAMPEP_0168511144 /NCGR_PEP_ID=MMETSP0405-20121227/1938_1 /TAXON_ID=498012 /ORGANISM="Trichosphaerium sp, Strain Am-I-7 wt" /LENGTH=114 /DNA_ID=CAMNT_0008529221 /DNA_START=216 /DNA_END=560 /DNA_ORIENTATION=-
MRLSTKFSDGMIVKYTYGMRKVDVSRNKLITDVGVQSLAGVHTIDLSHTDVTDDGLFCLKGVHTIKLRYCGRISDAGVSGLAGVYDINLSGCNVTDVSLRVTHVIYKRLLKCFT